MRCWTPALVLGMGLLGPVAVSAYGQAGQSATQSLLDKAHALEVRGRTDMAAQTWQQVLLADPNNTDALGGLARAAKLSGNNALAEMYIERLRKINPNDPGIARAENMGSEAEHNVQLAQAGKLAQQGQYAQAMAIYRKVYGDTPPAGDSALSFYETEAATEDGRPHAIAGLRSLVEKNPGDARYRIALGRILTYNPKTRAEGRKLLAQYPADPQAVDALRQSLLWDAQNPATAGDIRAYLAQHPDAQLSQTLRNEPRQAPQQGGQRPAPVPQTPEQRAASAAAAGRNTEEQAAYKALNARRLPEAEARFKAILAKNADDPNALAGMGYIRMQQANFGGAISFLVQAKQDGSKDPGVDPALTTSRFWYTMGEGAIALNDNDLPLAEKQYRTALQMRPTSVEALEGLGGTLLRAEQPVAAEPYFLQFVKLKPAAPHAWRGLFLAQMGAGETARALATERAIPAAPRAELARDPLFLRSLASAYQAAGREADAQRVLKMALDLPFPADARGVELATQQQYADLLQTAGRYDQAAGLYRQVLAKDQSQTAAWQGLVRAEHAMNNDQEALRALESMPPTNYEQAMREPGFESTVAAIYQSQGRLDLAQDVLEKSIAKQAAANQPPSVLTQVQLAGIYLQRNNPSQAYPLYQQMIAANPQRLDAWKGLLSTLHDTGRDTEALAEIQQIPSATRAQLEGDTDYLQTVSGIYSSLGQPQQAQVYVRRIEQHYSQERATPPAGVEIQEGWLLYNSGNDAGLYRQLLALGSRTDLTDDQRRTVQTQWATWAVRRANQASAAGNNQRALAILNATSHAFPDNLGVQKALAAGYATAGMPKQAIAIWKAQDLKSASVSDYKASIGAALAANDLKDAETWLRFGLDQYPKDTQLLILGAKFEEARGDNTRAADYYRASLSAMPAPDPGAELASELSHPAPAVNQPLPSAHYGQDLTSLLAPGKDDPPPAPQVDQPLPNGHPYLPSVNSGYGNAPVQFMQPGQMGDTPMTPSYNSNPAPAPATTTPRADPGSTTRLRDYVPQPQGSVRMPSAPDESRWPRFELASTVEGTAEMVLTPASYQQPAQQQANPAQLQQTPAAQSGPPGQVTRPGPLTAQPVSGAAAAPASGSTDELYGPYVPYHAPAPVKPVVSSPTPAATAPAVSEVLPTARYVPNAKVKSTGATAARRPAAEPRTGESKPPAEDYTVQTDPVQYNPAQAAQQNQQQTTQPAQPGTGSSTYTQQNGNSNGQQYPQPGTGTSQSAPTATHRRAVKRPAPAPAVAAEPAPAPAQQPALSYPGVAQPLTYQPYPTVGPPVPLGAPPTDADLLAKRVPPLRGGYDQVPLEPQVPLTERQQTERDLQALEAGYSAWLGGTASARYRSGTVGLDRLTDLEVSVEASATVANNIRFTVVPKAVFLNSGTLDNTQFVGLPVNSVPFLGTLPASAIVQAPQQVASGVGGEFQVAGRNFAAAIGYTPYEFLVQNYIGRVLFKPTKHFTLYGSRDSVTETQLSYAGLRDPGQATAVFGGPVWGGVVATGGGVRFDYGDERAGFYITADGADLTGYHVLQNDKFEGSAGAYFLAHTFPGYGRLSVGASIFGMHYAHNERGLTYGLGGYFSPDAYVLASVPVTFVGRYHSNFHYSIAGSVGVQSFQEDAQAFFPLDRGIQTANGNLFFPTNSNTGGNYSINAEGAYKIQEHWYAGGFLSANNTNNYNTVTGGFFVRYLFRPQYGNDDTPTGLFPVEGFRPLRVP